MALGIGGVNVGTLVVHVKANAVQFNKVMGTVTGSMIGLGRTAMRLGNIMSRHMRRVAIVTAGAVAASIKAFASFDKAMTRSLAIMSDVTPSVRAEMEELANSIANKSVTSATDLAEAYFYLASAGLDAEQSMKALGAVEAFAVAGQFSMAQATDLATDALSALGLKSKNADKNLKNLIRVTDTLITANKLANASTEQFSKALTTKAGAALKSMNIDMNEGVAVLAAYADQGIKAEEAGTMLSRMLRLMTKGFLDNRNEWLRLGVTLFDAQGNYRHLGDIINDLSRAMAAMSPRQKAITLDLLGFQARSQDAIKPLLGVGDAIHEYNEELDIASGATRDMARFQLTAFTAQMKILWNQVNEVGRLIGEELAPSLLELSVWFGENQDIVQEWAMLAANRIIFLKDVFMDFVKFMRSDFSSSIGVVWQVFIDLVEEAGKAAIKIAIATGKGIFAALKAQVFGIDPKELADEVNRVFDTWQGKVIKIEGKLQPNIEYGSLERGPDTFAFTLPDHTAEQAKAAYNKLQKEIEEDMKENFGERFAEKTIKPIAETTKASVEAMMKSLSDTVKKSNFGEDFAKRLEELANADYAVIGRRMDELRESAEAAFGKSMIEDLDKVKEKLKEIEDALKDVEDETKKLSEAQRSFVEPLQEWGKRAGDVWRNLGELTARTFDNLSRTFSRAIMEGKSAWDGFAKKVLEDLLAIIIRAQITKAMMSAFPSVFGAGGTFDMSSPQPDVVSPRDVSGAKAPDVFPVDGKAATGAIVKGDSIMRVGERRPEIIAPLPDLAAMFNHAPSVVIENNTGIEMGADTPEFDGDAWVTKVIVKDLNQYGPIRQTMDVMNNG